MFRKLNRVDYAAALSRYNGRILLAARRTGINVIALALAAFVIHFTPQPGHG